MNEIASRAHRSALHFWHNFTRMIVREPRGRLSEALRCAGWVVLVLVSAAVQARAEDRVESQPAVTFTFDFPGSDPSHYALAVAADGHTKYTSTGKLNESSEGGETFQLEFTLSEVTRNRIFDLARRSHYFEGELDSRKKGLASTGVKTLAYRDGQKSRQASYNYSPNPAVQELTQIFQGMSATLEFGHRLDYYHRYQKLALDEETKRMEEMAKDNDLVELQALTGILEGIATDATVINVVRARAQRILDRSTESVRH